MTTETYIDTARFDGAAEAIAALEPCWFHGVVTRDQVMMTLVEFGVLPEIIRADVVRAALADAEIEARKQSGAFAECVADKQLQRISAPAKSTLLN